MRSKLFRFRYLAYEIYGSMVRRLVFLPMRPGFESYQGDLLIISACDYRVRYCWEMPKSHTTT